MTNHAAEARNLIEVERTYHPLGWGTADAQHLANLTEAQVHATLALVEQQRIANLIALARTEAENESTPTDAMDAIWDREDQAWNGVKLHTRTQILEALGL